MKREMQSSSRTQSTTDAISQDVGAPDAETTVAERAKNAREEVRQRQPLRAFDASMSMLIQPMWNSKGISSRRQASYSG